MMKRSKRLLDWSVDHLRVKIKTINTDVCARVCIRWCIIFFSIYSHSHNTYTCSIPSTGFYFFVSLQKSKIKSSACEKKTPCCIETNRFESDSCLSIVYCCWIKMTKSNQCGQWWWWRLPMLMLIFGDYYDHYCGLLIDQRNFYENLICALVFFVSHRRLKSHPEIDQYHTRVFKRDNVSIFSGFLLHGSVHSKCYLNCIYLLWNMFLHIAISSYNQKNLSPHEYTNRKTHIEMTTHIEWSYFKRLFPTHANTQAHE